MSANTDINRPEASTGPQNVFVVNISTTNTRTGSHGPRTPNPHVFARLCGRVSNADPAYLCLAEGPPSVSFENAVADLLRVMAEALAFAGGEVMNAVDDEMQMAGGWVDGAYFREPSEDEVGT